ncbi:low temperature requirement protein A [Nocardioides taihuensis]|uniref:Low temperature requirement protein A n=1 Tax=Nocardioides taihuensis TaxID=1835606 RepID=A0ABW0BIE0_9ACTN
MDSPGRYLTPATMRDHDVAERASTPLELLFDLCFVVAVAVLAAELHHGVAEGHGLEATLTYSALFVPLWWAWMSYTWFATAFSHDDPQTRLLTLLQMGGVLAVAAAVPSAVAGDLLAFAVAYALMRLPLVLQWLRAAHDDPAHRAFALTYAVGSVLAQVLWLLGAAAHGAPRWVAFIVALGVELATPVLAVRRSPDRVFHPGHIAERYGLFTIIVLGETILAVSVGLQEVLAGEGDVAHAAVVVGAALVLAFGLWWVYFDALGRDGLTRNRRAAFTWGYGHYVLYASVAALGAGVQVQLDDHALPDPVRAASVAAPVALSLAAIAWLQVVANRRTGDAVRLIAGAGLALGVLASGWWAPAVVIDLALAAIVVGVVLAEVRSRRAA